MRGCGCNAFLIVSVKLQLSYFVTVISVCFAVTEVIFSTMSTVADSNDDTKSTILLADVSDDSCRLKYIEIVTRDTDGPCTTECDSGDWSAQVKQENSPLVKQEPHSVCSAI